MLFLYFRSFYMRVIVSLFAFLPCNIVVHDTKKAPTRSFLQFLAQKNTAYSKKGTSYFARVFFYLDVAFSDRELLYRKVIQRGTIYYFSGIYL